MIKVNNSFLAAGAGKTNATLARITAHPHEVNAPDGKTRSLAGIVYVTTREEIEKMDVSRFLANFGPQRSKKALRKMRGHIIFTVAGYDDVDSELFEVPDVRAYYSYLHAIWPCWLYMSCLAFPSLRVVALSVIPNLSIVRSENACRIHVPESELLAFFTHSIPAAALLHHRVGLSKNYGFTYLKAVAKHLGIPDD